MGGAENAELLKYFSQRKVCLVEAREGPVRISTYASALNVVGTKSCRHQRGLPTKYHLPQSKDSLSGRKLARESVSISPGLLSHRS